MVACLARRSWWSVLQQPSALLGGEPVAETDPEAPDALDAADARSEFRAQQPSIGGLVRDPPNRRQPEVDRRRRVLPLFEVDPITEDLSLPEIRYLLWSLSLRAWTDTLHQSMPALLVALLAALQSVVRSRLELGAEILALRHQLAVLQRQTPKRPRLGHADRWLWVLLSRVWWNWQSALQLVRPDTVVRWHRRGFARYWRWRSSRRRPGRPALAVDVRALIQQMHGANPRWGAPRVHGELRKLGLHLAQATVAKYFARHRGAPPTQTWRTFLTNHTSQLASCDFFTVPTATFRVLFVFVVLSHDRRRIVHINVTAHPTAVWTAQQLREAWPWDTAPRFLIRDRDTIYTSDLRRTGKRWALRKSSRPRGRPGRRTTLHTAPHSSDPGEGSGIVDLKDVGPAF